MTIMDAGSHIVASSALAMAVSVNLLAYTLPRFGIWTTFVDARDEDAIRAAIRPETRLIFGETVGNPDSIFSISQRSPKSLTTTLSLLVDSTFTTPYLRAPLRIGADLVMHSATKFLSGRYCDWRAIGRWRCFDRMPRVNSRSYQALHGLP